MQRTYSIGTLLLIMTIVAVGLAGLRSIQQQDSTDATRAAIVQAIISGLAGAAFGFVLTKWNGATPIWRLGGWARLLLGAVWGGFLGAAAGARALTRVDGESLVLTPVLIVGGAVLFVLVQRLSVRGPAPDHDPGA